MAFDAGHGLTVLFGGEGINPGYHVYSDTWVWDGSNWTLMSPANSPAARSGQAMAYDAVHGNVVLFGGLSADNTLLSDTWLWDGTNWTQASPAHVPPARWFHCLATAPAPGGVVLFGGSDNTNFLSDLWVWNGTDWTQQVVSNGPTGRWEAAMTYDSGHGVAVLFGGEDNNSDALSDTWEWNGTNWVEQFPSTNPGARQSPTLAYAVSGGYSVLFGGWNQGVTSSATWLWDGSDWTQSSPATIPLPRADSAAAYDSLRGQVVIFGGEEQWYFSQYDLVFDSTLADTAVWGGPIPVATWVEQSPASNPPARSYHAMAYDVAQGQTVLFGGLDTNGDPLSDTWTWNGVNWTEQTPVASPPPRNGHAMAYDSAHGVIVLFGGYDQNGYTLSDTWLWNGVNWTMQSPANNPGPRAFHSMTYDMARGNTVLFGGLQDVPGTFGALYDTWVWNGTNWTQEMPAVFPGIFDYYAGTVMAYDTVRSQSVLFGGTDGFGYVSATQATWTWGGASWTCFCNSTDVTDLDLILLPQSPPARAYGAMAYDSVNQLIALFGGSSAGNGLADTWTFDGLTWTQQAPSANPSARYAHAMAYDQAHAQSVLFGGSASNGSPMADTWLLSLQLPCTFSVSQSSLYLDATSQRASISITASASTCAWTSATTTPFLAIASGAAGTGNGTVTFSVSANSTGADRTGTLTVAGQTISVTQRANGQVFTDVPPSAYYFDFANLMDTDGITAGCQANPPEYCPNSSITRAEMAVFLVVSVMGGSNFNYTLTPYFTDVPASSPYFTFIQKLKDLGITDGCSATEFCPNDSVTRDEMAAFIIRSRYETTPFTYPATPYFTDEPPTDIFFPFVQKMAQDGITAGCGGGLYCPAETLNRGQMAVFIVTGVLNQLLPAGTPYIASVSPNVASPGQTLSVALTGANTTFVQGTTQVTAALGIIVSNVNVSSPTTLTVQLAIPAGMASNPTSIIVTTVTQEADLPNGLTVQ